MRTADRRRMAGLTYVEVLIATVLMVVALVPAIDALRPAIQGSGIHQSETALHYHLTGGLEEVLARPFVELDTEAQALAIPPSVRRCSRIRPAVPIADWCICPATTPTTPTATMTNSPVPTRISSGSGWKSKPPHTPWKRW